ncbi:hypothetical protein T01_3873, partial [Trichinella spiralis]
IPSEGPKRSFRTNSSPVKLLDRPFKFSTKSTVYISYSLIAPELLSRSGRTICYMAIIIMHRKSIC